MRIIQRDGFETDAKIWQGMNSEESVDGEPPIADAERI